MPQKAKEPRPPDRKLAVLVLICKRSIEATVIGREIRFWQTSYEVPTSFEKQRIKT